jgi:hypothetical protein
MHRIYKISCFVFALLAIAEAFWIQRLLRERHAKVTELPAPAVPRQAVPAAIPPSAQPSRPDRSDPVGAPVEARSRVPGQEMRLLNRDGLISDEYAQAHGISEAERLRLNELFDKMRDRVGALAATNATVTQLPNGRVAVDVPPFVEKGRALYEELDGGIAEILGPDRARQLLGRNGDQIEKAFDQFGAMARGIMFSRCVNIDGSLSYGVSEEYRTGTGAGSYGGTFRSFDAIVKRYRGIVDRLPNELSGKKDK